MLSSARRQRWQHLLLAWPTVGERRLFCGMPLATSKASVHVYHSHCVTSLGIFFPVLLIVLQNCPSPFGSLAHRKQEQIAF